MADVHTPDTKAIEITGKVWVVNDQGNERVLAAGDAIKPGETVMTSAESQVVFFTGTGETKKILRKQRPC